MLFAYREVSQESTGFVPFELLYGRTVRGPKTILKQLWTKEVEDPEVKTSYEYVFDLRERLEDCRSRSFKIGGKVLILLPTDNNKVLMLWKGPFVIETVCGVKDYGIKIGDMAKLTMQTC